MNLSLLADNPQLLEAVKSTILKQFALDNHVPKEVSYDEIGKWVMTRVEGAELVEKAFKEIESHKTNKEEPQEENPAR